MVVTSGDVDWAGSIWASTPTGAAGSAATPVTGDDVYILFGSANITSGLNQTGVALNSLTIGFNGSIGTDSASLQIGLGASDPVHIYGGGTHRLAITETSSSVMNIYSDFSGVVYLTGGTLLKVICGMGGQLIVSGSGYAGITTMGCGVTIESGGSSSLDFTSYGGNHIIRSSATTVTVLADTTTVEGVNSSVSSVYVNPYSTYYHNSGGTISSIEVSTDGAAYTSGEYGGFTVTDSAQYAGSKLFPTPSVLITYTNATVKYGWR